MNFKDSIPPIMKQELNSQNIALYKKAVISSFEVFLLHNKIFWAIGTFSVKKIYNWIISFSSLLQEYT